MSLLDWPYEFWGALCLLVALAWLWVWPQPQTSVSAWSLFWLRWGHALTWVFLATACFIRPHEASANLSRGLALLAGLSYGMFVVYAVSLRRKS